MTSNPRRPLEGVAILAAVLAVFVGPSLAQVPEPPPLTEIEKVEPLDLVGNEFLGTSLSFAGDRLLAGAPESRFTSRGKVYAFRKILGGWVHTQSLFSNDGAIGDQFGWAVAMSGDGCAITARLDSDNGTSSGSAYVFRFVANTWVQEAKIKPSDGAAIDEFGTSVAMDGDTIVVGARLENANGKNNAGSAYVFRLVGVNWVQEAKLVASDGLPNDWFGSSAAIDGDTIVVGAYRADGAFNDQGKAYVFARAGTVWTEQGVLIASDGRGLDNLGRSVDVSGDTVVVGAPKGDGVVNNTGAVYVFARNGTTWSEQAKVVAPDGEKPDSFGRSVSLDNRKLAVGATQVDQVDDDAGAAYVFVLRGSRWFTQTKLLSSDGEFDDRMGVAIDYKRNTVIVGAYQVDGGGFDSGALYVYEDPLVVFPYCSGKANSLGCVPFVSVEGRPSASSSEAFGILGDDFVPGNVGVLAYSLRRTNIPFHGGRLCLRGLLHRLRPSVAKSTGAGTCAGLLRRDFNTRIQGGADPMLTVGQDVRVQWFQSDPQNPLGFGDTLSEGLHFRILP